MFPLHEKTGGQLTIFLTSVSKEILQKVNIERWTETGVDEGRGLCVFGVGQGAKASTSKKPSFSLFFSFGVQSFIIYTL